MLFTPALRFFRRRSTAPVEQDPADLGTAFGMEASLEGDVGDGMRSASDYSQLESQRDKPALESPMAWMTRKTPVKL